MVIYLLWLYIQETADKLPTTPITDLFCHMEVLATVDVPRCRNGER